MAGKIKGSSKLAKSAKKENNNKEHLNLIKPRKSTALKAFRLYENDLQCLHKVAEKMNEASHRHVSETAVIRALLVLGTKTSPEKLIKALRETI